MGPPNAVSQTTANCCPSVKVTMVPLRPGQLPGSRVGRTLGAELVAEASMVKLVDGMVTFAGTDIEVTERVADGGGIISDAFTGYCGKPVGTTEVTVRVEGWGELGVMMMLKFAIDVTVTVES